MRFTKLKSQKDIQLKGVTISCEVIDNSVIALVITDIAGKALRIAKGQSYQDNLDIAVQEVLVEETHIFVTGSVADIPVDVDYGIVTTENNNKADAYMAELANFDTITKEERVVEVHATKVK